jgi:phage head maturation protease
LRGGAPALDSHSFFTTYAQVGVVDAARIEKGEGLATIRFPSKGVDEASDRMFALVSERIIRNISVGYTIVEVRIEEPKKPGEVERRIVTRWQPFEVSFVTVPADAGAQVREAATTFPILVERPASYEAARARMHMRGLLAGARSI